MARNLDDFMTTKRCAVVSTIVRGLAVASVSASCFMSAAHVCAQEPPAPAAPAETMPAPDAMPPSEPLAVAPEPIAPPEPEPIVPPEPEADSSGLKVDVGGGMILFYQAPIKDPPMQNKKPFFEVFEARLRLDAEYGMFGMHLEPVFRDTPERGFHPGPVWVKEAYGYADLGEVKIKIGKVFAQFGRFWDNSFYGNVQEYDGFKLDPANGVSVEGKMSFDERMGLTYFAQYFVIDGLNYSLPGFDTQSTLDATGAPVAGARRRNYLVGRVEPFMKLGDITTLKLGLSGSYFQADIPTVDKFDVGRIAIDATAMIDKFTAWAEYTHQFGQHVTTPNRASKKNDYAMIGAEYTYDRFTFRYNFNFGSYVTTGYKETRHVPGIAVSIYNDNLFMLFEYALAQAHAAGNTALIDSSFNITLHGKI